MRALTRRLWSALLLAATLGTGLAPAARAEDGVNVDKPSAFRNLVPREALEQSAAEQYQQLKRNAAAKHVLVADGDAQVQRLRIIADRIVPHVDRFNAHARDWKWEVNLINSRQINAFCMPGGKIAFYTGLLQTLRLSDDEVAMVMGHEVAHALREHARERIGKTQATRFGAELLGQIIGRGRYADAFHIGGNLLSLKFSRDDETEADVVGLDLAARAGFDPRAGITLWQKMLAAQKNAPPAWLSTHPSGSNRIDEIRRHLPEVMPLYERARSQRAAPQGSSQMPRDR